MNIKSLFIAGLVLFCLIGTAYAADSVEIRSTVLEYMGKEVYPSQLLSDFDRYSGYWPVLYYDGKNNLSTESVSFETFANDTPLGSGQINIRYKTFPVPLKYEYSWTAGPDFEGDYYPDILFETFGIIGFFGEPFVAFSNQSVYVEENYDGPFWDESGEECDLLPFKADKLAPLLKNEDEKYTLKIGDTLDLGGNYTLLIEQIDVGGNKTHLVLNHNGVEIGSSIVNASQSGDWILEKDFLGMKGAQVMRLHVKAVFQGMTDALVEIDGIWLADYLNAFEIKPEEDFGKWKAVHIGSDQLVYLAEDIQLNSGRIDLGRNWSLKVQDGFEIPPEIKDEGYTYQNKDEEYTYQNRFYLFREYTEPGIYELRSIPSPLYPNVLTYMNFIGFYYDLNKNLASEALFVHYDNGVLKGEGEEYPTQYVTAPVHTDYEYLPNQGTDDNGSFINSWDSGYDVMGYFGDKYVPLNIVDNDGFSDPEKTKADIFAPLVRDDDQRYTLKTHDWIELGSGYKLYVSQIDLKGHQVYLELYKDDALVNSSIVTTASHNGSGNWIFTDRVRNVKDVQLMRVHAKSVFQGQNSELVEIDGIWLTDFKNITDLKSGEEVGLFKYKGLFPTDEIFFSSEKSAFNQIRSPSVLVFYLKDDLTLTNDMDQVIAQNLSIRAFEFSMPRAPVRAARPMNNNFGFRYYFYTLEEIVDLSSGNNSSDNGTNDTENGNPAFDSPEDLPPNDVFRGYAAVAASLLLLLVILLVAAYLYRRYAARKQE